MSLRRVGAWAVHLLTASGAVLGLMALGAVAEGEWRLALVFLTIATLVDGVDGSLMRLLRPELTTPGFDGALLDNIVDYLNYVVVPAFLIWRAGLLPQGTGLAGAAAVLLVSAYQFCQRDAKTHDHYFKGFPSYWNVVVFYLLAAGVAPKWGLLVVGILAVAVFVPLRWIYPTRMTRWRGPTLVATALWCLTVVAILWLYPEVPTWLLLVSLSYVGFYVALSVYLGNRPRRP